MLPSEGAGSRPPSPLGPERCGSCSKAPRGGLPRTLGPPAPAAAATQDPSCRRAGEGMGLRVALGGAGAGTVREHRRGRGLSGACGAWTPRPEVPAKRRTSRAGGGRAGDAPRSLRPGAEPPGAVLGTARQTGSPAPPWVGKSSPGQAGRDAGSGPRAERQGHLSPSLHPGRGHRQPWAWSHCPQWGPAWCCPGCLLRWLSGTHTCQPPPRQGPSVRWWHRWLWGRRGAWDDQPGRGVGPGVTCKRKSPEWQA